MLPTQHGPQMNPSRSPLTGPTPASAYVQQQRLIKRYHGLLADFDEERIEALMHAIWRPNGGTLDEAQLYGTEESEGFLNRIEEHVPELVWLMNEAERDRFSALLDEGRLPTLIRQTLSLGQRLKKREDDPNLKLKDDYVGKGFGIGHFPGGTKTEYRNQYQGVHDPANPSARWYRRQREKARAMEKAGTPVPAPPPPRPIVIPKPQPPKPMVVVLPVEQVYPNAKTPKRWQPWHGQQLAFWPDAPPAPHK